MSSRYIPDALRKCITLAAGARCGYCLSHQDNLPITLEIEHIVPLARGGATEEGNIWLACNRCNDFKGTQVQARDPVTGVLQPLFHPRRQRWRDHFQWDSEGVAILGLTPIGRATIEALQLNHPQSVAVRRRWVAAGWHPPRDADER